MSEEQAVPVQGADDQVKNMKAEFDRKLANMQSDLQKSNDALMQQLQQIAIAAQQKPAAAAHTGEKSLQDLMYEDPEAYARKVQERAVAEAEKRAEERLQAYQTKQVKYNETITKLTSEYPELNNMGHELTKKALEVYNGFTDEEKNSAVSYRLAVKEAASELGIVPASKRKQESEDDDSFTLQGDNSSYSSRQSPKKGRIDPKTVEFAKLIGVDTDSEAFKKDMKEFGHTAYSTGVVKFNRR